MQQAGKYRRAANGLYLAMPQQQLSESERKAMARASRLLLDADEMWFKLARVEALARGSENLEIWELRAVLQRIRSVVE